MIAPILPPARISKQELATINQIRLGNLIAQFQELIQEFSSDEVESSRNAKLHDAIELYLEEIIPVLAIYYAPHYTILILLSYKIVNTA